MEEQGSKRKRVYPFEPNTAALLANFSREYLTHLLPALAKIGETRSWRGSSEEKETDQKKVMFEVSMALAASAGSGFAWSRALRQKLEGGITKPPAAMAASITALIPSTCSRSVQKKGASDMKELCALPPLISMPFAAAPAQKNSHMDVRPDVCVRKVVLKPRKRSKRKLPREEQMLHGSVRSLRGILPGGEDMDVAQLLSEVGSYVVCLELQVEILRSLLVGAQEQSQ